ncbi:MAG: ABC transporter substrate-binding protein [Peptoniphilaceae bacterium]|nr:ABC transporter substrate-binding protein [Peptoniphilaceae bacterium]MDD7383826.1 ABC transporter substrate-binding protein [Peptoniphilaceae bacterium]MDY3737597.1 ABC transporter substrate-binding protein [Peptoniphilaceae bacterium]
MRKKFLIKTFLIFICTIFISLQLKVFANKKDNNVVAFVGNNIFESSLDPIKGAMSYGYPFINNALLKVDKNGKYIGDLAESWKISDDGLKYTYKLKNNIKFSDGSKFDADDVVFTYNLVKKNQGNNENVDLSQLKDAKKIDEHTVEFTLKKPYSPFFDVTSQLQIVPSDSYDSEKFDTMPIGTGAYKVIQYDIDQQIILQENENYFEKKPKIKNITLVKMDSDTAFAKAKSGQIDIVMVSTSFSKEKLDSMNLEKFETMDVRNVSLPLLNEKEIKVDGKKIKVGNDVTSDIAVRKALSIGIDRQKIIDNAFNSIGKKATNFTNNLEWAASFDIEDNQKDEAKKILEDSGWIDEDGDGIREKNSVKCSFDLFALGDDEDRYKLAVALSKEAKKLGINIETKISSWDEAKNIEYNSAVVWGWGQFSPTVLNNLYNSKKFMKEEYSNVVGFNNTLVDEKINQAILSTDIENTNDLWKEVQNEANKEYPYLFIANIEHCYFIKNNLDISKDTQIPHPHGHGSPIICNMKDWKWR